MTKSKQRGGCHVHPAVQVPEPTEPTSQPSEPDAEHLFLLQAKQHELESHLDDLTHHLESTKIDTNSRAPIHRLPSEILGEIFRTIFDLHDEERLYWNSNTPPRLRFLLYITRITHHLRTVAIQDALLWTHIDVYLDLHPDLLALQLQRSGTEAPLDIAFDFGAYRRSWKIPWETPTVSDSSKRAVRPPPSRHLTFRSPLAHVFHAKQSMSIEAPDMYFVYGADIEPLSDAALADYGGDHKVFTGGAPKLCTLILHNLVVPTYFDPPMEAVHTLHVAGDMHFSCAKFREAVRGLVNLQTLVIDSNYVVCPEDGEDNVIVIPSIMSVEDDMGSLWDAREEFTWAIRGTEGKEYR
ncbi:hypothetical protein Hypma_007357 [Hypsizygus marmoreus]|uniref:F-box domain-containing protein n=1 Tax=Hypsizygus marmoreus TaxID=39966 RepID=A0A369JSM3_HYPMA|nr:hypothetical protein Hypma_007357 [Hypsizygus marmoreus]